MLKRILLITSLLLVTICILASCDGIFGSAKEDEITVSEDGYLVVNGIKTEFPVEKEDAKKEDVVTVDKDGYLVVNGAKTDYKVEKDPVITIMGGYVVVNGVRTEYEIKDNYHSHSYSSWMLYDENVTNCAKKLYYRMCSGCSGLEWKNGDHEFGDNYSFDTSVHWQKCKNCDYTTAKQDHTVGADNLCTTCGAAFGETQGIIYEVSEDGTYAIVVAYEGDAKNVRIAEEYHGLPVKEIYQNAFYQKHFITSVMIPNSVTTIGNSAFYNCYDLTNVVIGDSVTYIGDRAFESCSSLTDVMIPDSVTSIGYSAFWGCYSITSITIPNSVTIIDSYTFFGCSKLASITIPDSVTYISSYAFVGCNSALYTEHGYGKYVKSGDNPYAVLIEITNKNFSNYEIHENTKTIADSAFSGCSRLTNIIIPDNVVSIGDSAFSNCQSLNSVVIGKSVTHIGSYAFNNCSNLNSIVIGDRVNYIGTSAFSGCDSITSITIPDSVTSIGSSAFAFCDNLTTVVIGNGVTTISNGAFSCCNKLTSVEFKDTEGWTVTYNFYSDSLVPSDLEKTSTAAYYLKYYYECYTWNKE